MLLNHVQDFQETPNSVLRRLLNVKGSATPAAPKKSGRGPGRPKKTATAKAAPKKRGRKPGRPKKSASAATAAPKKRGRKPGRPKKSETVATAAPKKRGRKPGRPKKSASAATAAPKKRGRKPGRPPKAKSAATPKRSPGKRGRKPSKSVRNVSAPRASSSYHKLYEALQSEKGNTVEYTFGQVEKIIGSKLPDSAAKYPAWWSNNTTGHRKSWLAAGYLVDGIDLDKNKVTFKR